MEKVYLLAPIFIINENLKIFLPDNLFYLIAVFLYVYTF